MLSVVAVVLTRLNVVAAVVISPPSTFKSPSKSNTSLATVIVPPAAPMLIVDAAPAKFNVVAVALTKLNVVWSVVKSPPLTATSPAVISLTRMSA